MTGRKRLSLAIGAAVLATLVVAAMPATPAAAAGTWLDRLNAWRASVNLPALTENTTWSQGDAAHSLYMVKNDQVTHYELSTLPYYTAAGDTAAKSGNIEVSSTTSFTDQQAIDWWMGAPFHAMGMMDPRLSSTGFGSYREVKSGWDAGFTLDTIRGNAFTGGTYPVFYPGNNSIEPLTSYSGNEFPDPLQACPGYTTPTGLPVFVEVGGNVSTSVGAHTFTGNGTPLAHCAIDSSNAAVGSYLKSRGGVIIIPQAPLHAGVTYTVAVTVNGVPYTWSFGVSSDGSITAPSACPATATLPAVEPTTEFSVTAASSGCTVSKIEVQIFDTTLNQGWFELGSVATGTSSVTVVADGYPGHTYQVRARGFSGGNLVSPWTTITTQVSLTATASHVFKGIYTLDGWGGVHGVNSAPLGTSAYWPNWNIARAAHFMPGSNAPQSGAVLDGWGGLHPYGAPITIQASAYWPNWDIARDFAFLPDGTGGFVLDGWGGLHPFRVNGNTAPLQAVGFSYWPYRDIARKVVIFADGTGGYTLDGYGGVHPFGINQAPAFPESQVTLTAYWPGWLIARDFVLIPGDGGHSGYVMDGWGGVHPFDVKGDGSTMPGAITTAYWPYWDIARGMWLLPGSATAGYTLDGWGGVHPFGGAQPLSNYSYWSGWDIARVIWGA